MISLSLSIRLCDSLVGSILRTKIFDSQASFLGAEVVRVLQKLFETNELTLMTFVTKGHSFVLDQVPETLWEFLEIFESVGHVSSLHFHAGYFQLFLCF